MNNSSLTFNLNFLRNKYTAKYIKGVSNKAMNTLKANPLTNNFPNNSQGKISKKHNKSNTENVSTACEVIVEKLFRTQSIFPLVTLFQK